MRCVSSNIYSPCPSIVEYKFSASCPTRTAEAWQSAGLVLVDVEFFFPSIDLRGIREALFSFGFFFQDATVRLSLVIVSHMVIRLFARLVYHIELLCNQHFWCWNESMDKLTINYSAPSASDVLCNLSCIAIYLGQYECQYFSSERKSKVDKFKVFWRFELISIWVWRWRQTGRSLFWRVFKIETYNFFMMACRPTTV